MGKGEVITPNVCFPTYLLNISYQGQLILRGEKPLNDFKRIKNEEIEDVGCRVDKNRAISAAVRCAS